MNSEQKQKTSQKTQDSGSSRKKMSHKRVQPNQAGYVSGKDIVSGPYQVFSVSNVTTIGRTGLYTTDIEVSSEDTIQVRFNEDLSVRKMKLLNYESPNFLL